jgi:hypothetical protein
MQYCIQYAVVTVTGSQSSTKEQKKFVSAKKDSDAIELYNLFREERLVWLKKTGQLTKAKCNFLGIYDPEGRRIA